MIEHLHLQAALGKMVLQPGDKALFGRQAVAGHQAVAKGRQPVLGRGRRSAGGDGKRQIK